MGKGIRLLFQFLGLLLCLSMVAVLVGGCLLGVRGYSMYQQATEETSLQARVEAIRASEDYVSYEELPEFYCQAVICTEDRRFFTHWGIDLLAIARAAWNDLRALSFVQGGSTITQQLAKNLLFTQEKQLTRKAAEVFAALRLEALYSKEEIFALYVNTISFGNGYVGIGQAARGYFGKEPGELTDYECAMLAGLPNAPSAYSPTTNPQLARERTQQVLESMVQCGVLSQEQAHRLIQEGLQSTVSTGGGVLPDLTDDRRSFAWLLQCLRGIHA